MPRGCKAQETDPEWLINDNIQGCKSLVIPPRITTRSEFSLTSAFTLCHMSTLAVQNQHVACVYQSTWPPFPHHVQPFEDELLSHPPSYLNSYNISWWKCVF
jgi:hypothetical protein